MKLCIVMSLMVFSGCDNNEEKVIRENLVRAEERNRQLIKENTKLKQTVAIKMIKTEGQEYLNMNVLIGLVAFLNIVWMIMYFKKGKSNS